MGALNIKPCLTFHLCRLFPHKKRLITLPKFKISKKSIDKTPDGSLHRFGAMMNSTYNLNDKSLHEEIDHNRALLLIMSKHVKQKAKI